MIGSAVAMIALSSFVTSVQIITSRTQNYFIAVDIDRRRLDSCHLTAETQIQSRVTSGETHCEKNATEASCSEFLGFLTLTVTSPLLHNCLSPSHEVCDSPEQATFSHPRS
jgi:hypothetical protein